MKKSLITYSTVDGQTKEICEKILELSNNSFIDILPINKVSSIDAYEKVVIGASIRYGNYRKDVFQFINKNIEKLELKENAFFSVNVVARKPEKNTAETNPYINKFLKISKWKPNKISVFAGKVDYPNYNFFDKYIIKFIMFITKGPTDTSQSFEFTDWLKVDDFSKELRDNYSKNTDFTHFYYI